MASTSSEVVSSSTSPPAKWDVFLSYRGKDTRHTFTDHLYNTLSCQGIQTFRDDPELRSGEVISDELFRAIEESKTYVVVLSKNYASSHWCLDELVKIFECKETRERAVIPVFYNIEPSVVRYQTGSFKEAFKKYETPSNYGCFTKAWKKHHGAATTEEVKKWRDTLTKVSYLSGITCAERSEVEIIDDIVDRVVQEIIPTTLPVPKYLVGMGSPVKHITSMLRTDNNGVMKIGMYGMRGVGKTTLAKSVYNENHLKFQGSCFLANVRGNSLESLQQKLINDVLKSKREVKVSSVDEGTRLVRARLCSTKILVVLDDLDSCRQFDSLVGPFSCGSVVIITTTNEKILDKIDVEPAHRYMVNKLDAADSLTLFIHHAFRDNDKPDNTLMTLSEDILSLAEGLPLALEVFGSLLYKQPEVGWQSFIEKLKRSPDNTIQLRLRISLDAVENDDHLLKKIFVDIACFFIGENKKEVVKILETYYPYTDHKIEILKERCLLTISNKDKVGMHGLLIDMGKDIARNNSPDQPEKYSRLWLREDIRSVLKTNKGTEAIECMIPHCDLKEILSGFRTMHHTNFAAESYSSKAFRNTTKLRFLCLNGENLTGSLEQIFEELRWFCWTRCPLKCLPSHFNPEKLVALLLSQSSMRTLWERNKVSPVFENLKTLNMSCSPYLTSTPDFTKLPCLVTLNLEVCKRLQDVHVSIGSLTRLVLLDLHDCVKLRCLPDTICNLRALTTLNVDRCHSIEGLPTDLGNIKSLKELGAVGLTVSELPDSIGKLSKLIELRLGSKMDVMGRNISCNTLESLPDTFCMLRALEVLNIGNCSTLKALPVDLGNIKSLQRINAEGLSVLRLPDSIGCLSNLVELRLNSNKSLGTLPNTISKLTRLKVLDIGYCSSLQTLPTDLGKIESLNELNVCGLPISNIPNSIGKLSMLTRLTLRESKNLKTLPDDICDLRSLKVLDISSCENLEILPDELWKLTRLRVLNARNSMMLKRIPDIPSNQIALPLETLILSKSHLTALPSRIGQLSKLHDLDLRGCRHLLYISELPPNLEFIQAEGCENLESIPNLSNLKQLEELKLNGCRSLKELQGLEELTSLTEIGVKGCSSLNDNTFTERFFQVRLGFRNRTYISGPCIPCWFNRAGELGSRRVCLDVSPHAWHDFLGIILYFNLPQGYNLDCLHYTIKTTKSSRTFGHGQVFSDDHEMLIAIPKSTIHVRDGEYKIEVKSNFKFGGIHPLYKREITGTDQ